MSDSLDKRIAKCWRWFGFLHLFVSASLLSFPVQSVQGAALPFQTGDVFAGVGNGQIKHFRADGTFVQTLNTGAGGTDDTGMAFDAAGNLYATAFQNNNVYKFDQKGNRVGSFGSGYNQDPESIVFDKNGNAYVGQADGSKQVLKFNSAGTLIDTYSPQIEDRGTDWIDLAADQCTLHYTSEGSSIKRYNICTKAQLPDFATGLSSPCYAHRIRPNFEVLVACTTRIYRLNSAGRVMQTYTIPGTSVLFALNLDSDNKTFWTGDLPGGWVFRIDIATGKIVTQFNTQSQSLAGLTIAGEITAAVTAPPPTTSYYVRTRNTATLNKMGADLARSQIAAGTAQDSVVVLLFGGPTMTLDTSKQPQYGATGFSKNRPVLLADVANLVEAFAIGYYNALGNNTTLHVRIVIGTSNSEVRRKFGGNQVNASHGTAWGTMVNSVASRIVNKGYAGQVDIAGGFDAEPGYNTPASTRAWVDGYALVAERYLYDVGDSGGKGCPQTLCEKHWTAEDLWYVAWGASPSIPLPEIYRRNGEMATQWAYLSLYAYQNHNQNMIMAGALTTLGTCKEDPDPSTCLLRLGNTPGQGWQQLYNALNLDTRTAQTLPWSTDLSWSIDK